MPKTYKKNKDAKFITYILLSIISIFCLFYSTKKILTKKYLANFLQTTSPIVDSILKTMTIEQKIAQIFISQDIQIKNPTGGIISDIYSNSIFTKKNFQYQSFTLLNQNNLLPQNIFKSPIPKTKTLIYVSDSSLISDFITITNDFYSAFNIKFIEIPFLNKNFYPKIDSTSIKLPLSLTYKFLNKKNKNHKLLAIQLRTSKNDSINIFLYRTYKNLIKNGINVLILNKENDIEFVNKLNFQGLSILKMPDTLHFTKFINSNIDMLITKKITEADVENFANIILKKYSYQEKLDYKVKKVLLAKYWLSLSNNTNTNKINTNLFLKNANLLIRKIYKNSIIALKNTEQILPIKNLNQNFRIFYLQNNNNFKIFVKTFNYFTNKHTQASKIDEKNINNLLSSKTQNIILLLENIPSKQVLQKIRQIDSSKNLIILLFGQNKNLKKINFVKQLLYIPQKNKISEFYAAQAIFGAIKVSGKITLNNNRIKTSSIPKIRLGYDIPQMLGLDENKLKKIDSIVRNAIKNSAFPGCQIFIAKDGFIFWDKSYGYHTYAKKLPVKNSDLYDIASITKIAATTLTAMKMFELGKLNLDKPIGTYFKNTKIEYKNIKADTNISIDTIIINSDSLCKKTNKDKIRLNDSTIICYDTSVYFLTPKNNIFKVSPRMLLMHKSGITPSLPILNLMLLNPKKLKRVRDFFYNKLNPDSFYTQTKNLRKKYYSDHLIKDSADIQVAKNLFLRDKYFDTLWQNIKQLKVSNKKRYVYSDVNMILLQMTIDTINKYPINKFVENYFYKALNINRITFRPLKKFGKKNIIPTENDRYWRKQVLQGYVQDPSAAIFGGIAGNAGLFANAYSLGIIGQMLLDSGKYGGTQFLKKSTVVKFTKTQKNSHRGLGFDKWSKNQIIAKDASHNSFGHTGFTGTCLWIDPDNNIVFVFLSNRVYPSARNQKINQLHIRQKIQETIYNAMLK